MRIYFLAHRLPYPVDKGEKIRTFHQIQYLVQQGYQVSVFAPIENVAELQFAKDLRAKLNIEVFTAPLGSAIKRKVKAILSRQAVSQTHFFSNALLALFQQSLQQHPDVIVCTSSVMAAYLYALDLRSEPLAQCQLIMDFMDLDSDKWTQYARSAKRPLRWIYSREAQLIAQLEQRVYHDFARCFFISDNEVNLFSNRLSNTEKLSVLANGIDTKMFYPATPKMGEALTAPVFLFTGVMNYLPNEDAVIWFVEKMWARIRQRWPGATFYIVGMLPSLRVQALTKEPGVVVTGYVDEILPYYHKADIFVGPFRLARGVQNKILQAMACGLPVVTTALGAEGIACKSEHDILIADGEDAFLSAIFTLWQQPELCKALGQNACTLIRDKYSWDGVLQALPGFLNKGMLQ